MNSKTAPQTAKADVYARVTDRIVEDLAAGVRPWMKPWSAGHADGRISRPLRHNGTPYRGVNVLLLWGEAQAKGFRSPSWMTYKQAQELGGQVPWWSTQTGTPRARPTSAARRPSARWLS